jgi:uncharacterized membrane-anchored protein YjiN (DUF445 family)
MREELPRDESYDAALEEAVEEALEGEPRAAEWRRLKRALAHRRALIEADLDHVTDEGDRKKLQSELEQIDEHLAVLSEEVEITQFIEDTVRFSAEVHRLQQG